MKARLPRSRFPSGRNEAVDHAVLGHGVSLLRLLRIGFEEAEEGVETIINGSAFKSLRSGCESFSELARTFHLAAFIAAEVGDPFTAFQHTVCEACPTTIRAIRFAHARQG